MFNKEEHIKKQQNVVTKLLAVLKKEKISFKHVEDGIVSNIVFKRGDKEIAISHHSFYRYSGMVSLKKESSDNLIHIIPVTDEMWLFDYIKPIILKLLSL